MMLSDTAVNDTVGKRGSFESQNKWKNLDKSGGPYFRGSHPGNSGGDSPHSMDDPIRCSVTVVQETKGAFMIRLKGSKYSPLSSLIFHQNRTRFRRWGRQQFQRHGRTRRVV